MNILFCGDGNIADGVIISTLSLLKNTKETLNIYILTATVERGSTHYKALPNKFAEQLTELVKEVNPENEVKLFNISHIFAKDLPVANMETRFTPCCMLRLYADLVDGLPDRLLYLDNDVICRLDPSEFYNMDMKGGELAGVLDYYGSWFFKRQLFERDYLNSGVLLLDLGKIKETGLFKKCRERCRETEMCMPDQSAINKLTNKKIIVPRKYNEQRKLRKDTVFQHFTTSFRFFPWVHTVSVKPWNVEGMHKVLKLTEYDDILKTYLDIKKGCKNERNSNILFSG